MKGSRFVSSPHFHICLVLGLLAGRQALGFRIWAYEGLFKECIRQSPVN